MPIFRHFVPYHSSTGQSKITNFGGLLETEFLEPPPGRCLLIRQTYRHDLEGDIPQNLRKLIDSPMRPVGPYPHFHKFQNEYFTVLSGIMGIELDGEHRVVYPEDGEISVKAGTVHRYYIHPDSPGPMTINISATESGVDYQLDRMFLENWYGYWHDALLHKGKIDYLQYLAVRNFLLVLLDECSICTCPNPHLYGITNLGHAKIMDGGDVYPVGPKWVPFRRFFGYWGTIILGRWVGGLLGYPPYFREYTTDWDFAVAKMKGSWSQRWLVHESYTKKKSWKEQVALDRGKIFNADYEPWTIDLEQTNGTHASGSMVNGENDAHDAINGLKARVKKVAPAE
ncbi:putative oxidoreductase patJ [Paramyrothecium foliicola]|nr:putative oxidoreductase patJ [Paramyrothecium foliicola]